MEPMLQPAATRVRLAQTAKRELIDYFTVSAYLYICFGSLIFYKASILHSHGIDFAVFGLALAKALILGKFMLVAHALRIGDRNRPRRLAVAILWKSLQLALILIVLSFIEEIVVGFFKGVQARTVLNEIAGGTVMQLCATSLLIFLIMIPYFAFLEVSAILGEGRLFKMLMERR